MMQSHMIKDVCLIGAKVPPEHRHCWWLPSSLVSLAALCFFVCLSQGCGKSVVAREFAALLGYSVEPVMLYQVPIKHHVFSQLRLQPLQFGRRFKAELLSLLFERRRKEAAAPSNTVDWRSKVSGEVNYSTRSSCKTDGYFCCCFIRWNILPTNHRPFHVKYFESASKTMLALALFPLQLLH